MIFIGINQAIDAEKNVVFCHNVEAIKKTSAGDLVVMNYNEDDLPFYARCEIAIAVKIETIEQFMYLGATRAKYTICAFDLAIEAQKLADHYLLDIKVLAISRDVEQVALAGIDGIFHA
ncbi:MAG: hypothetical protein LBN32_04965 [Helicobacteraceae bacterium]|nr:hypothetical protein [Helicobacteraceae bacterium]